MPTKPKTKKRYGLRLNLKGFPASFQNVEGWPGLYCSEIPTLVGGPHDALTLKEARDRLKADKAKLEEAAKAWDAFERDNPKTFSGMYQFWCQRP